MKRRFYAFFLLLSPACGVTAGVEGDWNGVLKAGPYELRLVLHLARSAGGALTGTLDSLDQSAQGIPISKVMENGRSLTIEIKAVGASYDAELNPEGSRMTGTFHQSGQNLALTMKRGTAPQAARPQTPQKPYPYDEEEVSFENAGAGIRLAGTLTLPRSAGPHPAVLLITGSGPQDRDETIMGHRPFLVIADYLTRRGIAVLRVDDRGVGKSTGKFQGATTADFAGDARAGVDFLKTQNAIDIRKIGLIGHSEGAIIAPMLAAQSGDIAFIVLLAGAGLTGEEILLEQRYLIGRAMAVPEDMARRQDEIERFILETVIHEKDDAVAERKIREGIARMSADLTDDQRKAEKAMAAQVEQQIKTLTTPWFRAFLSYDPRPALEKVKSPVLAMTGSLDLQVPPKQNLPAIAAALEAGGNRDYEIVKLPGLNHLFQNARTGSPMEYSKIEETFAPAALDVMGEWIRRHTMGPKQGL